VAIYYSSCSKHVFASKECSILNDFQVKDGVANIAPELIFYDFVLVNVILICYFFIESERMKMEVTFLRFVAYSFVFSPSAAFPYFLILQFRYRVVQLATNEENIFIYKKIDSLHSTWNKFKENILGIIVYFIFGLSSFFIIDDDGEWKFFSRDGYEIYGHYQNSATQFASRYLVLIIFELIIYSFIPLLNERERKVDIIDGQHQKIKIKNLNIEGCYNGHIDEFYNFICWFLLYWNFIYNVSLSMCVILGFKEFYSLKKKI